MAPDKCWFRALLIVVVGGVIGIFTSCSGGKHQPSPHPSYVTSGQFTTAHPNLLDAAKDYFDIYPTHVQQPIAFNHQIHLKNGMQCTDCHKGVMQGPDAGIPSVKFCMTCHQVIATDKPEIKKVATYYKKGEDIPWRPVFWFYQSAHVKFRHAPHIRAGIDCAKCHADMRNRTVAVRKADLTMGFCVGCHRLHKAPTDCTTCHF
jgi:hypothetical protein